MKINLTTQGVRSLKPGVSGDRYDAQTPGLIVRVGAKKITYSVRFSVGKQRIRQVIGPVETVKLAEARNQARSIIAAASAANVTEYVDRLFGQLADDYLALHARPRKRTAENDEWMLGKHILPTLGSVRIRDIGRGDLLKLLERIATGKGNPRGPAPIMANRIGSLLSKTFSWAVSTGRMDVNPASKLHRFGVETVCDRVLDDNEVAVLWFALDASDNPQADIFKLLLLTGQRLGEVMGMQWSELDLHAAQGPTWTIPKERTKAKRRHTVPLGPGAVRILERLHANQIEAEQLSALRQRREYLPHTFVFPNKRSRSRRVSSITPIKAKLDQAVEFDAPWTTHDLRRTAGTRMTELGVAESIVGRILNHAPTGITAKVCVHASFDAEKRAALKAWDRRLMTIAYGIEAVERIEAGS